MSAHGRRGRHRSTGRAVGLRLRGRLRRPVVPEATAGIPLVGHVNERHEGHALSPPVGLWTLPPVEVVLLLVQRVHGLHPQQDHTDRSSSGLEGTWSYAFEPDGTGTRVTVKNEMSPLWRLPILEHLLDRVTARTHGPRFARAKAMLESEDDPIRAPRSP